MVSTSARSSSLVSGSACLNGWLCTVLFVRCVCSFCIWKDLYYSHPQDFFCKLSALSNHCNHITGRNGISTSILTVNTSTCCIRRNLIFVRRNECPGSDTLSINVLFPLSLCPLADPSVLPPKTIWMGPITSNKQGFPTKRNVFMPLDPVSSCLCTLLIVPCTLVSHKNMPSYPFLCITPFHT